MSFDYESYRKQGISGANLDTERIASDDMRRLQAQSSKLATGKKDWIDTQFVSIGENFSLRFWVQLASPECAIWVNFAQQKATQQFRMGKRTWHQQINVGVADITIDLRGRSVNIRITGGGPYFEFSTSGKPVYTQSMTQGDLHVDGLYKAAVIGVKFTGTLATATILGGARQEFTSKVSKLKKETQVNLADEPVITPWIQSQQRKDPATGKLPEFTAADATYKRVLYESWAPNHPFTGMFLRAYNFGGIGITAYDMRGSIDAHDLRDVGFDVPWAVSDGINPIRRAFIRGEADWPRASGLQTVKSDQYGTREFGLYFDAFNQIAVFPTAAIEPLHKPDPYEQNVKEMYVRRQKIPLPTWVYQPTMRFMDFFQASGGSVGAIEFPEIDWKLHPDGTRACAVVVERQAALYDTAYWTTNVGTDPYLQEDFDNFANEHTGFAARHNVYIEPDNQPQRYFIGSGLVEITLEIQITGSKLEDFNFNVSLVELRRPTTTPFCTMLAGYLWYDIEADPKTKPKTYTAFRGDMIVLDVERYYTPEIAGMAASLFSLKNITQNFEMFDVNVNLLIDYDLPTASFVFGLEGGTYDQRLLQPRPGVQGGPYAWEYTTAHQGATVFIFGKYRTMLFPDTLPQEWRDSFTAAAKVSNRAALSDPGSPWVMMPLNDMRGWDDPELADMRLYYALLWNRKNPYTQPPPSYVPYDDNWWTYGMNAYLAPNIVIDVTTPRFSWYVYADEIMNRMQISPYSTFFVHPSGTWAFFDNHRIYNPYGVCQPQGSHEALTPCIQDMNLEHIIYDVVHLENKDGHLDTSFTALYNQAVGAGRSAGTLLEPFDLITKADLQVQFSKERVQDAYGVQWLQLRCTWGGQTIYYYETGFQGGAGPGHYYGNAGGLTDLTMGSSFYAGPNMGLPLVGGARLPLVPIRFSSCVMVTK